ncbi:MAG TPA: holo-ACP synthase [Synergistaceae bacterium]|nr:holo-ACP synthase [Synergistaceae bacterium]
MILGLGVDACSIERMERHVNSPYFEKRVFMSQEREYAKSRGCPARHFAGAFAAREAFAKATGMGLGKVGLQGCWVERTSRGPLLRLSEENKEILRSRGVRRVFLSITHEENLAVAVVILEGEVPGGEEDML